jgi:hemoglobin
MQDSSVYQAIGGREGCRNLSELFYARVERDPVLLPLFPAASFRCAIEALASFLAQFLGGPCEYANNRWSLSLREAHLRFKIGAKERTAWLKNMGLALDDAQTAEPARSMLLQFFEQESAHLVNHPKARPSLATACLCTARSSALQTKRSR